MPEDKKTTQTKREEEEELIMSFQQKLALFQNLGKGEKKQSEK